MFALIAAAAAIVPTGQSFTSPNAVYDGDCAALTQKRSKYRLAVRVLARRFR